MAHLVEAASVAQHFLLGVEIVGTKPRDVAAMVGVEVDLKAVVAASTTHAAGIAIPQIVEAVIDEVEAVQLVVPARGPAEVQIRGIDLGPNLAGHHHVQQLAVELAERCEPQIVGHYVPLGNIAIHHRQMRRGPLPDAQDQPFGHVRKRRRTQPQKRYGRTQRQ